MPTVVSQYQPIWNTLKEKHTAKLVAPQAYHRRIIKAVTKRKDVDLGYKFLCSQQDKKAILRTSISGNTITFTLEFQYFLNSTGAY